MIKEKKIYCDECKQEFLLRSNYIEDTYITIGDKELKLTYFLCPYCNRVYKILLVDGEKRKELLEDVERMRKRLRRVAGKGNAELLDKLQKMLGIKCSRLKSYVDSMNRRYPGEFYVVKDSHNNHKVYYRKSADYEGRK